MARIRSVKPSLRTSRVVATWKREVRYFWVLLWGYLDDKGRGLDMPKAIAGDCFPLDDDITAKVIDKWLTLVATTRLTGTDKEPPLCRYEVDGRRYIHSLNWDEHQKPNRPSPSQHPPCPIHEGLTESVNESPLSPQVLELEGLTEGEYEGVAREPSSEPPGPPPPTSEPPSRCPKHLDNPDPPPCGPCGTARKRHERWQADNARHAATERQQHARAQAEATRTAINRCRDCDTRGYLPTGKPCPHDPDVPDRTRRGAAAARAALTQPERTTDA